MVDQLTQLTTQQRDRLPSFVDEWIAKAHSTTPLTAAEWQAWDAGMHGYYSDARVAWPGVVVRVGSPIVGALAAPVALRVLRGRRRPPQRRGAVDSAEIGAAIDAVIDSTLAPWFRSPFREGTESGMDPALRVAVTAAASAAVTAALSTAPTPAVHAHNGGRRSAWVKPRKLALPEPSALGGAVDRRIYREVFRQLCPAVFRAIDLAIDLPVELAVISSIPMAWRRAPLDHSYSWPIVSAFFRDEVGLVLAEEFWQRSRAYQDALSTRYWWPTRDFVMVCDRPVDLHVEGTADSHRLHNAAGPAIRWADGWALYFWHGIQVPADLIETDWAPDRILTEPNAEIRRCAIERTGWDRFIATAGFRELDRAADPANPGQLLRLYDLPNRLLGGAAHVLVATNATRERDGSRRSFGLTVPVDCRSALTAAAWTFDLAEAEYINLARAT
ncbi:MAG: DUF6745 domain-containing protein [Mycobacterium sp.]